LGKTQVMLPRILLPKLIEQIRNNKLILLKGPRSCGKQTLVTGAIDQLERSAIHLDLAAKKVRKDLSIATNDELTAQFKGIQLIVLHEAQYMENLENLIELVLSDTIPSTLILCCSFRPVLSEELHEAIRMEGLELELLPMTFYELAQHFTLPEEEKNLERRLVYGSYPQVIEKQEDAEAALNELVQEAIFTQLGAGDRINKEEKLIKMLQIISFTIGEPISYNEIGERCGLDNETVERYVELLEHCDILFKLPTYYNGFRYELKKTHVFYFFDNGIRNALIRNFNPIDLRNDVDALWKNWLISERIKWNRTSGKQRKYMFWRTHTRQTIDLIEFSESGIQAYKSSWEKRKKIKFPKQFTDSYPSISTHTLNRSTYWGFLSKK
jgi:predicted AAA+ superfamily ATPase